MIIVNNIEVFGWKAAIRGMRNPMNSWKKSDSCFCPYEPACEGNCEVMIGHNDLKLMKKLVKGGVDESKFMRMIHVQMDIIAPLYWWKEFDTYKVGTVTNSCSTMHKIHDKEFTLDDFSYEHLRSQEKNQLLLIIRILNENRENFIKTKDKNYWWQMIQLLPNTYIQKRTVDLNYEVLRNMYFARKNHKLDEWRKFCNIMIDNLPYFKYIILDKNEIDNINSFNKAKQFINENKL